MMGVVRGRPEGRSAGIGSERRRSRLWLRTMTTSDFGRRADLRGPDAVWRIASGPPKPAPRPKSELEAQNTVKFEA